jgi:hypothetical protein
MFKSFLRHWKGYLALLAGLSLVIFFGVHYLIRHSGAFETAVSFVRANPEVARQAGAVRDVALSWTGASIEVSGGGGSAQLTVDVTGTRSSPQVYVELRKRGIWEVSFARLLAASGESVVLQESPP